MSALLSEPTAVGEQTLVPGVAPVSMRTRLEARMAAPMLPSRPQKPADCGLFDLAARNQLELFGASPRPSAPHAAFPLT